MLEVEYATSFIRQFKRLDKPLQGEVLARIELFKHKKNHQLIEVHKLHGNLASCHSFSINFHARILFRYSRGKRVAQLLAVGGHEIYD